MNMRHLGICLPQQPGKSDSVTSAATVVQSEGVKYVPFTPINYA